MSYKRHKNKQLKGKNKEIAKQIEIKNIAAKKKPIPTPPPEAKTKPIIQPKTLPKVIRAQVRTSPKPTPRSVKESEIQTELERINSELSKLK